MQTTRFKSPMIATVRAGGVLAALAAIGLAMAALVSTAPASAQGPEPALLDVDVQTSCLSGSGRVDVAITNTDELAADFNVIVGTVGPRVRSIAAGTTGVVTVTGRPEGPLTVVISTDLAGEPVTQTEEVFIACGPARDVFEVETSCLAGRGRVDAWVTAFGWPHVPDSEGLTNWTVALARLDPSTNAELPHPIIRRLLLPSGHAPTRVSITGRLDGEYLVRASSFDETNPAVDSMDYEVLVEVDCIPNEESSIANSCLAGNGRVDVFLSNSGIDTGDYEVTVGRLAPRPLTLAAGRTGKISVTGRPDGLLDVTVTRNGEPHLDEQVEIVCDITGARITVLNLGPADFGYPLGPLANAEVTVTDLADDGAPSRKYTTDLDGRVIADLPPSQYRFSVSHPTPTDALCWYIGGVTTAIGETLTEVVIETAVACA